jgi:TFIIB-like protein
LEIVTVKLSSDDYSCFRCNAVLKWEQLTTTRAGNLLCADCWDKLNSEPIRKCPVDSSDMEKKRVLDKFLIDRCKKCGGTWFDKGELKIVQQEAKNAGMNEGLVWSALFLAI